MQSAAKRSTTEHLWKPGVSGNPSGKPKSYREFVRACRERTPEAIETIARLARGEPLVVTVEVPEVDDAGNETGEVRKRKVVERVQSQTQLAAAQYLVDRGWGKAVQPIEDRDAGTSVETMTDAELLAVIEAGRVVVEAQEALVEREPVGLLEAPDSELVPTTKARG